MYYIITTSKYTKEITLSDICTFQEGYVNPSQRCTEYFGGKIKWLRASDINESFIFNTGRTLTKAGFESAKNSALLFNPNTIAISKSGTIGKIGIIFDYMCGNRAIINIKPKENDHLPFIYCYLKSKQCQICDMATGSVQKNLYISLLESLKVVLPSVDLFTKFNQIGIIFLSLIKNSCIENIKLIALRNAILPKLMSGELNVSEVDI